ncbi:MAG: hypothetical protein U0166_28980 [Acidobacteriota bacterium]
MTAATTVATTAAVTTAAATEIRCRRAGVLPPPSLFLVLAALLPLLGCRERPLLTIWPFPSGALLPLVAASPGSTVTEDHGRLVLFLRTDQDIVVSRGGHALPIASSPVLHLRVSAPGAGDAVLPRSFDVRAAAQGVPILEQPPVSCELPRTAAAGSRDLYVPLELPAGGDAIDILAIAFRPTPIRLAIDRAEIVPMTLRLRASLWWQDFAALRARPASFYVPSIVVLLLLLSVVLRLLSVPRILAGRPAIGDRWLPRTVVALVAAYGCFQGALVALGQLDKLALDFRTFHGATLAEKRAAAMGRDLWSLARRIDEAAPSGVPVAMAPYLGQKSAWNLALCQAPREVIDVPCGKVPVEPALVIGSPGCFEAEVPVSAPSSDHAIPGVPWEVIVPATAETRYLRELTIDVVARSKNVRAVVSVIDAAGRVISEEPLRDAASHHAQSVIEVPARIETRVRLDLAPDAGDGAFVKVSAIRLRALPAGFVPVGDLDERGRLLARPRDMAVVATDGLEADEERFPSRWEVPRLLLGLVLCLLSGGSILRLLFRRGAGPTGLLRLGLSFLIGLGIATLLIHALVTIHVPAWPTVGVVLLALSLLGVRIGRGVEERPIAARPLQIDERVLAGVAVALVAVAIADAFVTPMSEWDEIINWGYRGHAYYHSGPTVHAALYYARTSPKHKAYPPGIPLAEAFAAHVMGRWDDARAKAAIPMYYGAMVLLVIAAVRGGGSWRLALFYAVLAATAPMAMTMSTIGMADLPLGCLLLATVLCLERARGDRATLGWLLTAGLLASLMSFTKVDGGALKLLVIGIAFLKLVASRGVAWRTRITGLLGFLALAFVPIASWWYVYRKAGLKDWVVNGKTLSPSWVIDNLGNVPIIVRELGHYLFAASWDRGPLWGATYLMLAALAVLSPLLLVARGCRTLVATLVLGLCGYCLIYVVSPWGLYQIGKSFDRILLHFFPLAVATAGRMHATMIARREG